MPHLVRRFRPLAVVLLLAPSLLLAQVDPADAQDPAPRARPTGGFDRIFLSFAEDAIIAERQWWEVQAEFSEGDLIDAWIVRGIVAFQPWDRVEVGGRVGFGSTDTGLPGDGTGATDLDAWAKYLVAGEDQNLDLAFGGLVTVPTGDDTAGLGYDAFAIGFFGSARYRLERLVLAGNVGFRVNGDATILGSPEANGKTTPRVGAAAIFPASDEIDLVGEAFFEGKRFEGGDEDMRLAAGTNWRFAQRNLLRAAVVAGVTDGAPDWQILASYAVQFR